MLYSIVEVVTPSIVLTEQLPKKYAQHTLQAPSCWWGVNLHRDILIEISEQGEYCLRKIKYLISEEKNIFNG